jgi:ABC-type bacteriocin/lantibiotic exporter with double-glycine peptidase domain
MVGQKTKKLKQKKEKPLYSTWQNISFTLSNMWKWEKLLVFLCILKAPLNVVLNLAWLYIVRLVISLIENNSGIEIYVIQISVFCAVVFLLNVAGNIISTKIAWRQNKIRFNYQNMVSYKIMDADYENIENPDGMDKMQKADNTVRSPHSASTNIINISIDALTSIISIIALWTIITMLNPLLLIAITIITLIQYFFNRAGGKWHWRNAKNYAPYDRKLNHINHISGDFDRAKDIRLYNLKPWLQNIFADILNGRIKWHKKSEKASFCYYDINQAITQFILCNGITWIYIIHSVSNGTITIAGAVFYLSAISTYSGWIMGVINNINSLNQATLSICHLREFLDIPDKSNRKKGIKPPDFAPDIEFENVSFVYPKSEKNVLDKLSFKIKKGEKIAIVGQNGAGKTTLAKLISALYQPSGGDIKIDGSNIGEYNRDEYQSIISPVFQDIYLFPASVAENVALCEKSDIDTNKLSQAIQFAGLQDKIDSLPNGHNTPLIKSVVDDAIELSGGEKQKLALARALYKNGLILILDEPTAALDPIAENEIYLKYNEFAEDKTSIFISHRLASTRFCDRIFFLDDGNITETGSHDELMAQNGKYAEMFNIQSHYYREDAANEKT